MDPDMDPDIDPPGSFRFLQVPAEFLAAFRLKDFQSCLTIRLNKGQTYQKGLWQFSHLADVTCGM